MVSLPGKVGVSFNFLKPCWQANWCCHCTLPLLGFHRHYSLSYGEDTLSWKISFYTESYTLSLPPLPQLLYIVLSMPTLTCNIVNLIVTICEFLGALHLEENEGSLRWVKVTLICGHKYRYLELFGDYNC